MVLDLKTNKELEKEKFNFTEDVNPLSARDAFNRGVEKVRLQKNVKGMVKRDFRKQAKDAVWEDLEIEEVGE